MKRFTITPKAKRIMAVSCSHGLYAHKEACEEVVKHARDYKPDVLIHLGDFMDTTCLRGGSAGHKDEAVDLQEDFNDARHFLLRLRPTHVLPGNHEERPYRYLDHHRSKENIIGWACVREIRGMMKECGAKYVEEFGLINPKAWLQFGDTLFGHGVMYGLNAVRDHVHALGSSVCMGHIHTPQQQVGSMRGGFTGTCVGMLADVKQLGYAHGRASTFRWGIGYAFGEFTNKRTNLWVATRNDDGTWNRPR